MKEILVLVACLALPTALSAQEVAIRPPDGAARQITFAVKATPLGKTLPGIREESFTVSPDGRRIAYVVGVGDKAPPTPLPPPTLLPVAVIPGKVQVVVDGVAGPVFKPSVTVPVFSPDSQHVAYSTMVALGRITIVMVDGVESPPCRRGNQCTMIGRPVFSPDGRHLAYIAQRKKNPYFSMSSKIRMALDDSEGHAYDWIAEPTFTPDNQLAYFAWPDEDRKTAILVKGSQVAPVRGDASGQPVFSADGQRMAFVARRPDGFVAVLDGHEGPLFDQIGLLAFDPSGRLAYAARRRGRKSSTVIDGSATQEHPQYSHVGEPVFSSDGRHMAYWAYDGKHERVVVDGVAGKAYDEIGTLLFSPDGRHLAVEARLGPKWRLVVDGVDGPEYTPPRAFPVERDSRHLLHRNRWIFERPDLLTYVGVRDGEMMRWEVQITEAP